MSRDARPAYVGVDHCVQELVMQLPPVGLADGQHRGEDPRLVSSPWMFGIEGVADELVRRDDRLTRSREMEPTRHVSDAMAALGRVAVSNGSAPDQRIDADFHLRHDERALSAPNATRFRFGRPVGRSPTAAPRAKMG
jgi:hypothetical protein